MSRETQTNSTLKEKVASLHTITVQTISRVEFHDVTIQIHKLIADSGVHSGVCHVYVPHTSAAVLVQENADRALQVDLDQFLSRLAPSEARYHHNDGNCDAHLKASIIGCSKTLLIEDGRLVLGTWQGVHFCEFDGPRHRKLHVKIVSD